MLGEKSQFPKDTFLYQSTCITFFKRRNGEISDPQSKEGGGGGEGGMCNQKGNVRDLGGNGNADMYFSCIYQITGSDTVLQFWKMLLFLVRCYWGRLAKNGFYFLQLYVTTVISKKLN